jgi:G2/mitotic-specific cyclin-B, other
VQVDTFVTLPDNPYTCAQILWIEEEILGALNWKLTVPTLFHFLSLFIKASADNTYNNFLLENMAYFLFELGMINFITLNYIPSMVSVAAVFASRCTIMITPNWTEKLILQTTYSEEQVEDCARSLVLFHSKVKEFLAIANKYSNVEKGFMAHLKPAKSLYV